MEAIPAAIVDNAQQIKTTASKILNMDLFYQFLRSRDTGWATASKKNLLEDASAFDCMLDCVGSLNPRHWRGKQLHHGVGLCVVCCLEKIEREEKIVCVAYVVGFNS